MIRRTRTAKVYKEPDVSDLSFTQTESGADDSDEWCPSEVKVPKRKAKAEPGQKKAPGKKPAKPKVPKEPKPRAPQKPRASKAPPGPKASPGPKARPGPKAPPGPKASPGFKAPPGPKASPGPKAPKIQKEQNPPEIESHGGSCQTDPSLDSSQACKVKEERLSFALPAGPSWEPSTGGEGSSSSRQSLGLKKEEPLEDFTFDEPALKRQKTDGAPQGRPSRQPCSERGLGEDFNMNWDPVELLSERSGVEPWVCVNVARLLQEENTIPFMVRYRKDLINHLDADAVRDIQLILDEIRALARKTQTISQSLKKDGVLTAGLEAALRNCRAAEELDHVYAPHKKDSGLTKAKRARELGLEPAALQLLSTPQALDLLCWVRPGTKGLSTVEEVATGVEQILADMIAKDAETLKFIRSLCDNSLVMLQSSVSKTALKEQQALGKQAQGQGRGRGQGQGSGGGQGQGSGRGQGAGPKGKPKDIDNFHLYHDFTCNIKTIQHHQTLAINRGENLKILTVKVNIPDRVRSNFCRWCLNLRWRPKGVASPELLKILQDAVEDSYKRLLMPLLTRSYRSKLTAGAEKESISMFVRNLRQRLLVCPVRGRVLLGVDPGFRHGCKLAVLSPTSQILHTDVAYLHTPDHHREADKLRSLLLKYSCSMVVIGNGTACRETESFFADLISRRFFQPLDVTYCITNEAGASIYSVSAEAVKEMPDLDPNLRSAVSIGRRVQDPLAELVKIDPKHIGIGTYQHDVSAGALKAALDGVVQECVSFVGVDVNICSETLMRHVSGLNAGQARSIVEWRERSGPFRNREQLRLVKGVGPKSYQQCAGFIRINPHSLHSETQGEAEAPLKPSKKGGKKTKSSASAQPNPLDQTCIHPESYSIATRFLSLIGGDVDELGQPHLRQKVEARVKAEGLDRLASSLGCSPDTLQLIVDGLTQPPGFDIRQNFEQPDFKRGIVSMADLRAGTVLTGRVENAALFGAFVDIGVGRSGLIHKSKITPDKLPADSQQRSLTLGPGERVEVRVLSVDAQRGRIGLDLIRVLR